MIVCKSPREIAVMRQAGAILATIFEKLQEVIAVGISTKQLDDLAAEIIASQQAKAAFLGYRGFPANICTSINEELIHGIPSQRRLKEGDIISVDLGVVYKGYFSDAARSYGVGKVSAEATKLMEVTQESFYRGLQYAKAGEHLGNLCWAIGDYIGQHGYKVPQQYSGHGIGTALHEDPNIPNYGLKDSGIVLKAGMTLAIEPMVMMGVGETKTLADDWTVVTVDKALCAHYENTIVITENGYEILTI